MSPVSEGPYDVFPRQLSLACFEIRVRNIAYASDWSDTIGVIDGETNTVIANISDVNIPERMAVNPNTDMLYALSPLSNIVYVIDGHTNQIISKVNVGRIPLTLLLIQFLYKFNIYY